MSRLVLALLLLLAGPAAAQDRLTEADVRTFVERQERAWNAGDTATYFQEFDPRAVFVDQALSNENTIVPYGRSTLSQARVQVGRVLARAKVTETAVVRSVQVSQNGRGAAVAAHLTIRVEEDGEVRTSCAQRLLTVVLIGGRIRGLSQTDTVVRCPRGG